MGSAMRCNLVCDPAFAPRSILVVVWVASLLACVVVRSDELQVRPARAVLDTPESRQQLLVTWSDGRGHRDVTRTVRYRVADPTVVSVDARGVLSPISDGVTTVTIDLDETVASVEVAVTGLTSPPPIAFAQEVVPTLAKVGCSSGGCHGKAEGQNGFRLSVFGSDPQFDFDALVKQGRGRRIQPAAPERSLLLRKATGELPHGGGQRLVEGDHRYLRVLRWIAEGASWHAAGDREIVRIEVEPSEFILSAHQQQQLRVTAIDRAGRQRCVTLESEYQSNADVIAEVDQGGLVQTTEVAGAAAVLVRFQGHVAVSRITHPQSNGSFPRPPEANFIDKLAWDRLQQLGIAPSDRCDDATFLRRVYLDTIGTLPTPAESRAFLDSSAADKREQLIDDLLQRDEYADYWAMIWGDLLGADKESLTPQGAVAMARWLRRQFRENRPYDEFAHDIIAARGDPTRVGPAGFYLVHNKPEEMGRAVSQIFLGVRIQCAECHHHPFERWSQEDYFGFAGIFTGVKAKKGVVGPTKIVGETATLLKHPKSSEPVALAPLGGEAIDAATSDPRRELASWMTGESNPFFARALVNRLWAHYFGRGLVDPVDDIRATNPATNERLLDALAAYFVENDFDVHAVTRVMLRSQLYQRSAERHEGNRADEQNYSAAAWKPMPAEVLLDAVSAATGVPEQFNGWPRGYRAIEVWDNRMPSYFFQVFGRPQRVTVCECERGTQPSVAQALHLMNAPETAAKLRHRDGHAARLAASPLSEAEIVEELYLLALARRPSAEETALMLSAFERPHGETTVSDADWRRSAVEDVLWTLLNTKEFVYNH